MKITSNLIREICGVNFDTETFFNGIYNLSFVSSDNFLSWLIDENYLYELENNANISGVVTTERVAKNIQRKNLHIIICEDPMTCAIKLLNYIALKERKIFDTSISSTALISDKSYISEKNVIIGQNVIIEPFVTIMEDVEINDGVIIRSGARIGADNFDRHIMNDGNILRLISNNKVILRSGCEIGNNVIIDKGDSGRDTIIGENTMIHDATQVCHGVHIGKRNHIWGGTFFCGHCTTGDDVRIQPRSIISNNVRIGDKSYIGINSLISSDLGEGSTFLGTRALHSKETISALKDRFNKIRQDG